MNLNFKENLSITNGLFTNPIETIKSISDNKKILSNIFFLISTNFLIILLELPKDCSILSINLFSVGSLAIVFDYLLWSIKTAVSLTVTLGLFLWLNCFLNKETKSMATCFSISSYILFPTTILGLLIGDILLYVFNSDNTSISDSLVQAVPYASDFIAKTDIFMIWTVILLIIAGAIKSKTTILRNLEHFVPLWILLIYVLSIIFNT